MRKFILALFSVALIFASCNPATESDCEFVNFKYYQGEHYYLGEKQNNYILLGIDTTYSDEQIRDFIASDSRFDQTYRYTIYAFELYSIKEIPIRLSTAMSCEGMTQLISDLEQKEIISYAHYTMQTDNCENLHWEDMGNLCVNSYSGLFYVKVLDNNDLTALHQTIAETNTELEEGDERIPNLFVLKATKNSKGDALKMANYFHETGRFAYSEPDITKYPVE